MGRAKLPRKSTSIDMTAMCDVAFLLLSFFILTTKFKPSEAIAVTIPKSVAAKVAPTKDIVQVIIDKDGKVFLEMDDEEVKETMANTLNTTKNMGLDVKAFKKSPFFGAPFGNLKSFLALPEWMTLVRDAYQGKKPNLLLKGDNLAKFPAFKSVITAFKKNDFLKFQMVTSPEGVPVGTELWKKAQAGEKREE